MKRENNSNKAIQGNKQMRPDTDVIADEINKSGLEGVTHHPLAVTELLLLYWTTVDLQNHHRSEVEDEHATENCFGYSLTGCQPSKGVIHCG